jgi:serine/threonine-protein kinase
MEQPIAPGASIGGFRVEGILGSGGMGTVYRARSPEGAEVAIKLLSGEDAANLVFRERFRREARTAATVAHPGVVRCLGSGEHGRFLWIALELMPGGSLADRLRKEGALPWRAAVPIAADIARALAAIHAAGIVHRDLKPANVLLDGAGRPKLSDFGIARNDSVSGHSLTRTGEIVGTPEYLAPEQVDASKTVDSRADLYSLGALIHTLVVGSPPFVGANAFEVMKAQLEKKPTPLRALVAAPASLEALTARLLAKNPAERGEGAAAVALELDSIANPAASNRGVLAALLVVVALAVVTFALVVTLVLQRLGPPPTPPPVVASPPPAVASPSPPPTAASVDQGAIPLELRALAGGRTPLVAAIGSDTATEPCALAVSQDGKLAATGDVAGHVHLWDLETRRERWNNGGHRLAASAVAFLPGGRLVSSDCGGTDKKASSTVVVWALDGSSRAIPLDVSGFADVRAVAVAADGSGCLLGGKIVGGGGLVRLVDLAGATRWSAERPGNALAIWGVALSPDGHRAFSAAKDAVEVFDVEPAGPGRGTETPVTWLSREGHAPRVVAFLDAEHVLSGGRDHTVRRWRLKDGTSLALNVEQEPRAIAASSVSRRILVATPDGKLRVLGDALSPEDTIDLAPLGDAAVALAFLPSGREFVVATRRGRLLRFALGA